MTTAPKIDFNFPVLQLVTPLERKVVRSKNPLLIESREIFEAMGWGDLPENVKLTIAIDMIGFQDELRGLYSTKDTMVLNRRKRIHYWISNLQEGLCSPETVVDALRVSYLS